MNELITKLSEELEQKDKLIADLNMKNTSLMMAQAEMPVCPYMCGKKVQTDSAYGQFGSLDAFSWADIAEAGARGLAPRMFTLGSTKSFKLTDGREMEVRIIGFNHDKDEKGNLIPISFETTKCFYDDHRMNRNGNNKGGWDKSDMRSWLNNEVAALISDDLAEVIKPCVKVTSIGGCSDKLSEDVCDLWLLSEQEIFGRKIYSVGGEGHWYDYYRQENVDYGMEDHEGDRRWRWERSPYSSDTTYFCSVNSDGTATISSASSSFGVAFGFCV